MKGSSRLDRAGGEIAFAYIATRVCLEPVCPPNGGTLRLPMSEVLELP